MSPFAKSDLKESLSNQTIARLVKGTIGAKDFGPQLELNLEPLDHEIGGETGFYHEWYGVKMSTSSKLGALITALAELPGPNGEEGYYTMDTNTGTTDIGASLAGPVVGQIFVWETKKLSELVKLGKGMTDPELRIPIEALSQEEADARIAANGGKRKKGETSGGATSATNGSVSAAPAAVKLSTDERDALDAYVLGLVGDGLTKAQFVRMGAQDARLKSNSEFKREVVSLNWVKRQIEAGNISLDGDTYQVTEQGVDLIAAVA